MPSDSFESLLEDTPPCEPPIGNAQGVSESNEEVQETDEEVQEGDVVPPLEKLDTKGIHRLVVQSERWRNNSFNIGYELSQFKKMLTMCEDATIKVRRLVHNFEERMKDTQEQVWDENHQLNPDFDFKDISVAGLRDVILLHDWWAANAPGKTPEEMGMTDDGFREFRRRCNKVSYNLRKNQYAQLLAVRRDRLQNRISELEDIIKDKLTLHWNDKYGADAPRDEGDKWSLDKVDAKAHARIKLLVMADEVVSTSKQGDSPSSDNSSRKRISKMVADGDIAYREYAKLEKQYGEDSRKLADRTMDYLKSLGLVESEADLQHLTTMSLSNQNPDVSQRWLGELQEQKGKLDSSIELMRTQRKSL